jgi:hypothetical protein
MGENEYNSSPKINVINNNGIYSIISVWKYTGKYQLE